MGLPEIMSDARYDALALRSNPDIKTGRLDDWWKQNFKPFTGSWVYDHPEFIQLGIKYRQNIQRGLKVQDEELQDDRCK